jgi:cytochrome b
VTWNLPTRIIHWVVAACIFFDFFSEGGDPPHNFAGYLAAGLVLFRMGYGIGRKFPRENKLASLVYWLVWIDVIALGISGYLMGTDQFWGDETLHSVHAQLSNTLMGLTVLHLCGVFLHSIRFRKKTWMGMITGKRP